MSAVISGARSFLFVPASRPERFVKALDSGADCVILDLEDAVPAAQKLDARAALANKLAQFTQNQLARTLVRINAVGTPWHEEDALVLGTWTIRGLAGVMLPKAETAAQIQDVGLSLGQSAAIVPLVESLAGLDSVAQIAKMPQVVRLAFGHLDFQLDLGMQSGPAEAELNGVRFDIVAASRRSGLAAPIDGVTVDTSDADRLKLDCERAKSFGFGGKLCIHPSQVSIVGETFSPTAKQLDWAKRVLSEAKARSGETFSLDGSMIDLPVVLAAERTVARAGAALL